MACSTCGKTKVNASVPKSGNKINKTRVSQSNIGSPYGTPKVRISFSSRNR